MNPPQPSISTSLELAYAALHEMGKSTVVDYLEREINDPAQRLVQAQTAVQQLIGTPPAADIAPSAVPPAAEVPATPRDRAPATATAFDVTAYYTHPKGGEIGTRMGRYVAYPRMLHYIGLPPAGREVYRALCAVADNKTGLARVGYQRLGLEAGMDRSAAIRWVKKLIDTYHLVTLHQESPSRLVPHTYRVLYPKDWPVETRQQLVDALTRIRAGRPGGAYGAPDAPGADPR